MDEKEKDEKGTSYDLLSTNVTRSYTSKYSQRVRQNGILNYFIPVAMQKTLLQ